MPIRDRIERNTHSVRDLLPHMQGMRKADIIRRLENELGETAEDV